MQRIFLLMVPLGLALGGCYHSRNLSVSDQASTFDAPLPTGQPATLSIGERITDVEVKLAGYQLAERIAIASDRGRIDYLGLEADGDVRNPALIFERGTLIAILDNDARRTFSACRTMASGSQHWAHGGIDRYNAIIGRTHRQSVRLTPSTGRPPVHRLLIDGTMEGLGKFQEMSALIPSNLSPTGIPKSVRDLYKAARDQKQTMTRLEMLRRFPLGLEETELVTDLGVDWARVENGAPMLWYRKESFEILIRNGLVAAIEYPSRFERLQAASGGYYEPGIDWARCPR